MDKQNKYRGELREHFYGTKNVPKRDKNGHRIPTDEYRPHRDRLPYKENANILSTQAIRKETRDHNEEHLNGKDQYDNRGHGHRAPPDPVPAPLKLSRNYDIDYEYHQQQHQNHCSYTKKPNHNTHHHHTEPGDGCGDGLVYKNSAFRDATSSRDEELDQPETVPFQEYNHKHYQLKDPPIKDYDKARAHCHAADERFRQKYSIFDDDSITSKKSKPSQNTIISAKSGKDIRSLIRSQIKLQQALDHSLTHVGRGTPPKEVHLHHLENNNNNNKESDKGTSTPPNKPNSPQRLPDEFEAIFAEPHLDKFSLIDLKSEDLFSVNADHIVTHRVLEPMTRKIQSMYLNTLREEMDIMEYLAQVPRLVSEVYRKAAERKSSEVK